MLITDQWQWNNIKIWAPRMFLVQSEVSSPRFFLTTYSYPVVTPTSPKSSPPPSPSPPHDKVCDKVWNSILAVASLYDDVVPL